MVNKKRVIRLLQQLIAIRSENPSGDEYAIARFVQRYLSALGVTAKIHEFKKRRSNVIAEIKGTLTSHSLLLTPHLDTVPAGKGWSCDPFRGAIKNNRLYGLGATDCKVNIACALEAMQSLIEKRVSLPYTLVFAATANEESGSDFGLVTLLDRGILHPSAAVVLDADDFEIVVTQKGLMHLKIKVRGRRAHGAYPWLGVNAIAVVLKILKEVQDLRFPSQKNSYLRRPTVNIGTIRGGDKVNVVADWCECEIDVRYLPGTEATPLLAQIRKICRSHAKKFSIEIEGIQKPYSIGGRHPLVRYLAQAMEDAGARGRIRGSEGATVITFFQDKGIPAVATGFGREGTAHMTDEYVPLDNIYRGALALENFLLCYRAD